MTTVIPAPVSRVDGPGTFTLASAATVGGDTVVVGYAAAVLGHNFPDSRWYQDAYRLVKAGGFEPTENRGSWISRAFANIKSPFATRS